MSWALSRFRAGDLVEVRGKDEILALLDPRGCTNGMPFMPEMLQYCGRSFRVGAVAHKTCDMVGQPGTGRRLQTTVHLAGLRCDGLAHGGCQAECNLFWNDAWLKPAGAKDGVDAPPRASQPGKTGCTEAQLQAVTIQPSTGDGETLRYSCQATQMYEATQPLAWWDVRQYVFDVVTKNHSAGRVARVMFLAFLRRMLDDLPVAYRLRKGFLDWIHIRLTGRPSPAVQAYVPDGAKTPTGRLDLSPGDTVRIKPQAEIERTINKASRNRGLLFDCEEMAPYCGRVVKVRKRVTQIIEEHTGKMLHMKEPCIMLEGVVCKSEYAHCRLNCPRAIPSYWREIWLDKVEAGQQ